MLPQDPQINPDPAQEPTNVPVETPQAPTPTVEPQSQPEPNSFPAEAAPVQTEVTFEQPAPVEPQMTPPNGEMPQ